MPISIGPTELSEARLDPGRIDSHRPTRAWAEEIDGIVADQQAQIIELRRRVDGKGCRVAALEGAPIHLFCDYRLAVVASNTARVLRYNKDITNSSC